MTRIRPTDIVELVRVAPVDVSTNAAQSTDQVVGEYAAMTILAGQEIDRRAREQTPGQQAFGFGATLDPGFDAFAIPVDPSPVVGSALSPLRQGHSRGCPERAQERGEAPPAPTATVLGTNLTILALRRGRCPASEAPRRSRSLTEFG